MSGGSHACTSKQGAQSATLTRIAEVQLHGLNQLTLEAENMKKSFVLNEDQQPQFVVSNWEGGGATRAPPVTNPPLQRRWAAVWVTSTWIQCG